MPGDAVADGNRIGYADVDADQLAERDAVAAADRIVQRHCDHNADAVADPHSVALADHVGNADGIADRHAVRHTDPLADTAHDAAAVHPQLRRRHDRAG
jgi:hypothetical protein